MALRHLLSAALAGAVATVALCPTASAGPKVFWLEHGNLPGPKLDVTSPSAPGDKLQYFGGEVISAVNIVAVAWGMSVDSTYMSDLAGFYTAIVKSPWIDWMTEYDTFGLTGYGDGKPGSAQHIGRGTYGGEYTITPANTGTTLYDSDIQTEIVTQIKNGALPKPQVNIAGQANTLYMVDFPPGITITLGPGYNSCSSFGAYHETLVSSGRVAGYGVHPYCGYGFDTATVIHSHELAEAITDMEIGLASSMSSGRPAAWVDPSNGQEAGDICTSTSATVAGYAVQKIWSNYAKNCVAEIPICDGVMSPPSCRPCNIYDDGVSCSGGTPACARQGTSQGQCVKCTSFYHAACDGTATPVCDDSTYACVGCLANEDCGGSSPFCDTAAKTCQPCSADGQCPSGKVCDTGTDASKGSCVECTKDSQCTGGFKCDPSHTCVAPPPPDAGAPPPPPPDDAGVPDQPAVAPAADSSGCGCKTTGSSSGGATGAALSLLAIGLVARRRRRR